MREAMRSSASLLILSFLAQLLGCGLVEIPGVGEVPPLLATVVTDMERFQTQNNSLATTTFGTVVDPIEASDGCWGYSFVGGSGVLETDTALALQLNFQDRTFSQYALVRIGAGALGSVMTLTDGTFTIVAPNEIVLHTDRLEARGAAEDPFIQQGDEVPEPRDAAVLITVSGDHLLFGGADFGTEDRLVFVRFECP